jgi:hypothetical protein
MCHVSAIIVGSYNVNKIMEKMFGWNDFMCIAEEESRGLQGNDGYLYEITE